MERKRATMVCRMCKRKAARKVVTIDGMVDSDKILNVCVLHRDKRNEYVRRYESQTAGAWKQASEAWKQTATEKEVLIARLRSALENIRNNAAYDSGKADTQHDRDRFEIIRQRAETALQGGSDGNS